MQKFILIFSSILISVPALSQADGSCVEYDRKSHVEYNSTITISGKLRPNEMFENQDETLVKQFAEISIVLVSSEFLIVQGGEVNNPTACPVNEFTLYLTPENLKIAQEALSKGLTVDITGRVGAAESSIEEYDNAVLRDIVEISIR